MASIIIDSEEGIVPRLHKSLLGNTQAQISENTDILSSTVETFKSTLPVKALSSSDIITVFPFNGDFLEFDEDADIIRSPIADDQFERLFITTESGTPLVEGLVGGIRKQFDLGIPMPVSPLVGTVQPKSTSSFTRDWEYFYEEPDGTRVDSGTLTEGVDVIEIDVDQRFDLVIVPPKVTASANAFLVIFFNAQDLNGNSLGVLYPELSRYSRQNTFSFLGATATASFDISVTPQFLITYQQSNNTDFQLDRAYVYTFVSVFNEEGPPSSVSGLVSVSPTQEVVLTGFDTTVPTNSDITTIRIYRTVTDSSGSSSFLLVDEAPFGTTIFTDNLLVSEIDGDVLVSNNWTAPPAGLKGIKLHPAGFAVGFEGKTLYLSVINQLHAWPIELSISNEFDIVGIGISIDTIVVTTTGIPFSYTGQQPDQMVRDRYELRQSCVSKRSIADFEGKVVYASPDGLVMAQGTAIRLVSERFYRKKDWSEILPETMFGEVHDNKYFAKTDNTFLIWDFDEEKSGLTTCSLEPQGFGIDIETDRLFLIEGGTLTAWNEGDSVLPVKWLSKEFQLPIETSFSAAELVASGYPMTVTIFSNSVLKMVKSVQNSDPFKLIPMTAEKNWEFEISGEYGFNRFAIGTSVNSLKGNQ